MFQVIQKCPRTRMSWFHVLAWVKTWYVHDLLIHPFLLALGQVLSKWASDTVFIFFPPVTLILLLSSKQYAFLLQLLKTFILFKLFFRSGLPMMQYTRTTMNKIQPRRHCFLLHVTRPSLPQILAYTYRVPRLLQRRQYLHWAPSLIEWCCQMLPLW